LGLLTEGGWIHICWAEWDSPECVKRDPRETVRLLISLKNHGYLERSQIDRKMARAACMSKKGMNTD